MQAALHKTRNASMQSILAFDSRHCRMIVSLSMAGMPFQQLKQTCNSAESSKEMSFSSDKPRPHTRQSYGLSTAMIPLGYQEPSHFARNVS